MFVLFYIVRVIYMYGLAKTTESFYSELWRVGKIFMLNSLRPLPLIYPLFVCKPSFSAQSMWLSHRLLLYSQDLPKTHCGCLADRRQVAHEFHFSRSLSFPPLLQYPLCLFPVCIHYIWELRNLCCVFGKRHQVSSRESSYVKLPASCHQLLQPCLELLAIGIEPDCA